MGKTLYTLEVFLYDAPASDEFATANPVVSRTIEIRGDQTLQDLHGVIFAAFDRWDEHMYEFHFGKGPHDYSEGRYRCSGPGGIDALLEDGPIGDAAKTKLDSLGLTEETVFGYWFDFGDDWYHQVNVVAIGEAKPKVKYPRLTARVVRARHSTWTRKTTMNENARPPVRRMIREAVEALGSPTTNVAVREWMRKL